MKRIACLTFCGLLTAALGGGCPFASSTGPNRIPGGGGIGNDPNQTTPTRSTGGSVITGGSSTIDFSDCSEPLNADALRAEVLRLVNQARQQVGHDPLQWDPILEAQADAYACEMIHYDFFAHDNPVTGSTLSDRTDQFGYEYVWVGENLAAGQQTPQQVVDAWLDSPCHRKNLLHPAFRELGIGIREGGSYGIYWVQEFGRPVEAGRYTGEPFDVPGCVE